MKDLAERIAALSPEHRALFIKQLEQMGVEIPALPSEEEDVIPPRGHQNPSPLSIDQERLWFFNQMEPDNPTYNVYTAVQMRGNVNIAALQDSLNKIIMRHEAWRSTFHLVNGQAVQVVAPEAEFAFEVIDIRDVPLEERDVVAEQKKFEAMQTPFDLESGPIVRAALIQVADEDAVFVLTIHHIVMDRVSFSIFFKELMVNYESYLTGQPAVLPEITVHYADYAEWQRKWLEGPEVSEKLAYWKKQLADSSFVLNLPTDFPRKSQQRYKGNRQYFKLSPELFESIKALARKEGSTPNMLFLAAFKALLYRYTGQGDIIVGVPVGNRTRPEVENIIGYFLTTSALRTDVTGEMNFRELLKKVRDVSLGAYQHQDLPFGLLLDELKPERDPSRNPIFQACFVYVDVPEDPFRLPGVDVHEEWLDGETAKFDMTLGVIENEGGLSLLEYNIDLFKPETIARVVEHFVTLLEGIVADPGRPIGQLPMLTATEREQVFQQWNDTKTPVSSFVPTHLLFEVQAERTPDATAVVFEGEQLTYRELNARANQLAHHLQSLGVGAEQIVGLCMERSLDMLVGLLGILKAGGAYVALDLSFPAERLAYMLQDTQAKVIVTQESLLHALPEMEHRQQVICLDRDHERIAQHATDNLQNDVRPEQAAYVIYTSGSTGRPKGVVVEHRNLTHYVTAIQEVLDLPAGASYAMVSTLAADVGHTTLFPSLCTGGTLHVLSQERVADPVLLGEYFQSHPVDCLKIVPSHLAALLSHDSPHVLPRKRLVLGGEPLRWELVEKVEALAADCVVINHYGPTETTVGVLTNRIERDAQDRSTLTVPMGRPLANTEVYVLDANQQPVPVGVTGEVYIGGAGVTRGYLHQADLTAEKFIRNPFSSEEDARLYKTGDLARYLSDGKIESLGRADDQVKIRGFRIELGEIEATLDRLPLIREHVVVAREDAGEKRLVAYLVLQTGAEFSVAEMRQALLQKLPEYMVPTSFVVLDALPRTANGKVDRRSLPAPDLAQTGGAESYVAPRDAVEQKLVEMWESLLGIQPVGIRDEFFTIGGHSLLAMRLIGQIQQQFQKNVSLTELFQGGTIEHLANVLRGEVTTQKSSTLVQIQPHGAKTPLFFIHSVGGTITYYYEVAKLLGDTQPFYGLQSPGVVEGGALLDSTSELAALYLEEIRTIQPQGPYQLGGWSYGGVVALEMAQQLKACGEEVALLVMFDTRSPVPEDAGADEVTYALETIENLAIFNKIPVPISGQEVTGMEKEAAILHLYDVGVDAGLLSTEMEYALFRRLIGVTHANKKAFHSYEPECYDGKLTMFKASEREEGVTFLPTHGWDRWVKEVEVHLFPGNHFTMMKQPNLQIVVEQLQDCLLQASTHMQCRSES